MQAVLGQPGSLRRRRAYPQQGQRDRHVTQAQAARQRGLRALQALGHARRPGGAEQQHARCVRARQGRQRRMGGL